MSIQKSRLAPLTSFAKLFLKGFALNLPVQFVKFGMVGAVNTLIHGVVLWVSVETLQTGPLLGNLLAFFVADVSSFFMNSFWTFKASPNLHLYGKFLLGSLFALGLTLFIASAFEFFGLHYGLGFACIVLVVPPLNYWVLKRWAFLDPAAT